MDPIISPWLIYMISIIPGLQTGLLIISIILCILCTYAIVFSFLEYEPDWRKNIKKYFIFSIIGIFLSALIPSKETIIVMYLSNKITENVVTELKTDIKDVTKSFYDDIFKTLNEYKDKKEEKK